MSPGQRLAQAGLPASEESVRLAPGSNVDAQLTLVGKKAAFRRTSKQPGHSDVQSEGKIRRPHRQPPGRADLGWAPSWLRAPAQEEAGADLGPLLPAPGLTCPSADDDGTDHQASWDQPWPRLQSSPTPTTDSRSQQPGVRGHRVHFTCLGGYGTGPAPAWMPASRPFLHVQKGCMASTT